MLRHIPNADTFSKEPRTEIVFNKKVICSQQTVNRVEKRGNRLPTKRHTKEKKGIQPITTAILLIVVVFAIIGIYYIWTTIQNRAGNAIFIQNVAFEQTKTIIYVQNIGTGTVTLDSVRIDQQTYNIQAANCTVDSQKTTTITQAQTAEITINQAYNEEVHIRVICKDGTFNERYPQS